MAQAARLALGRLDENARPAALESDRIRIHPAPEHPARANDVHFQLLPPERPRDRKIFKQLFAEGGMRADRLVRVSPDQDELSVRKRSAPVVAAGFAGRIANEKFHRGRRLDPALKAPVERERTEKRKRVESAPFEQIDARSDARPIKDRVGIGKNEKLIRREHSRGKGRVNGVHFARPVARTFRNLHNLKSLVRVDGVERNGERVVRTAIKRDRHPEVRIVLSPQGGDQPGDSTLFVVSRNNHEDG